MRSTQNFKNIMAIRSLNQAEVNTLLVKLTLAGFIPDRDFKVDSTGQVLAKPAVMEFLKRVPAIPQEDGCTEENVERVLLPTP